MRSTLAIAGIVCVGALALGGEANAQISKFLQQPKPFSIDDRAPRTQAPQSRFFEAAQLRCTFPKVYGEDSAVLRFVFADSTGSTPPHATGVFEAEPNRRTPITNHRVEGGERRFTLKYRAKDREFEIDFAVKVDGSISMTQARVDGQVQQRTFPEGSCEMVTAAAAPERPSTPPRERTTMINAAALVCSIEHGDHFHNIEILFRSEDGSIRPGFFEPAKREGEGFNGDVRDQRTSADRQVRYFTLVFANGLEVDYALTAAGRLTVGEARKGDRRGMLNLHGTCRVNA